MDTLCEKIGLPNDWKEKAHDLSVKNMISHYYPYRVVIFLHEIIAVIMMPYFCLFFLPRCARKMTDFLTTHTTMHQHVGPVCKLSLSTDIV